MYMRPFTTSHITTVRLPPPRLPGGMSGSTSSHSALVRSLGYRNLPPGQAHRRACREGQKRLASAGSQADAIKTQKTCQLGTGRPQVVLDHDNGRSVAGG